LGILNLGDKMKSDDYVKYLTEQFVHYMNQPKDFRKQARAEKKQYKGLIRNELFGLLPDAISYTLRNWRRRKS
jgi:hypothetical protein